MPGFGTEFKNESPRIAAWTAHYVAKGCNSSKAARVAYEKIRRSHTWPPKAR